MQDMEHIVPALLSEHPVSLLRAVKAYTYKNVLCMHIFTYAYIFVWNTDVLFCIWMLNYVYAFMYTM